MTHPKISIIWLNHNSIKILPLVLQSLESIANLDYPSDRYELIAVDNGSTDGSFERIREFLEKRTGLRKKIIRLSENLGFAGGNNVGFRVRDRESKYVVLVNNDCIVFDHGAKLYVEVLESFPYLGAAQGVVLKLGARDIDSRGIYLSDLLIPFGFPKSSKEILSGKVFLCSAVEGTFPIFRVDALLKAFNDERVFDELLYGFGEDVFTSILLWRAGYETAFITKAVARHRRGATWSSPMEPFLLTRNYLAMTQMFSEKHKQTLRTLLLIRVALVNMLRKNTKMRGKYMLRGLADSQRLLKKLTQRYNELELPQQMPLIRIPIKRTVIGIATPRALQAYAEQAIIRNLEKWVIGRI
uniref:Glycosyltransferase family 2 protein n=1 Tax=Ignisphaera aggregans TaxID=334771 RepID=A0A7J2U493_9CREN